MSENKIDETQINSDGIEDYFSVAGFESDSEENSEYGIFGFLADKPIFGIEKVVAAEPAKVQKAAEEEKSEPAELTDRETSSFYDIVYYFGLQVLRRSHRVWRRIKALFRRPLHTVAVFAGLIFIFFDKVALRSFHNASEDFKKLRRDAKKSIRNLRVNDKRKNEPIFKRLIHYPSAAVKQHPHFFRTALNVAVPLVSFCLLIGTVSYWTGSTYALEVVVENNGEECSLGYISDESVFIEARTIVKERIDSGVSSDGSEQTPIANPTYKITRVKLNQLSDADAISDKLIENSDSKLVSACGVYIDGEFVCAVKNETDARSVFENILEEAEKKYKISDSDENSFADFVEDVEFVQGLYSDNESKMWEASRLLDTLENQKKSEAVFYTVQDGDTPSEVAQKYDISTAELQSMNKGVNFDVFNTGTKLTVSAEVNFVRVKIIKVTEKNVSVAFSTESTNSDKLFKGDKRVVRKGVKGTDKVTYLVTYIDGVQTASKEIDRVTLVDPVNEKIQIGTKSTTVYGSSSKGSNKKGNTNYGSYKVTTTKGKFVWPVSGLYTITSSYGYRSSGFHTGVDISGGNASGHIVVAADSGTVELVKRSSSSYGNQVIINHGNGVKTRYAHMLNGSISVSVGDRVSRGQAIGRVGSTGNSSGPHLHFEVIVGGNTVNPMNYIGR